MGAEFSEILIYACLPVALALLVVGVNWRLRVLRRNIVAGQRSLAVRHPIALALACAVALGGMALATALSDSARQSSFETAQNQFLKESELVESSLQQIANSLVYPLDVVRNLYLANPNITREQFALAINRSLHDGLFQGVRGISFVQPVRRDAKGVGSDQGLAADLLVNKYVEPAGRNQAALGQDLGADAVLREAAEQSMQSGLPVLSQRTVLIQDSVKRPGYVYFMPIYYASEVPQSEQERAQSFRGWAAVSYVLSELMTLDHTVDRRMVSFQLFDQGQELSQDLLYDSENPSGEAFGRSGKKFRQSSRFSVVRPLLMADRVYYLRTRSTPEFESGYAGRDYLRIALMGSSLSVLLAWVVWLLSVGRARALDIAKGLTADLDRLALVARRTSNAVLFTDENGFITWVNEGFSRITARSKSDAIGRPQDSLLLGEGADAAVMHNLRQLAASDNTAKALVLCRRKNGLSYWADTEVQAIRDPQGRLVAYLTVQEDVTERVRATEALEIEKERGQDVLTGANVGTWERNLVSGEFQWNERWCGMMGFASSEVEPTALAFWQERLHADDAVRFGNLMNACIEGLRDEFSCDVRARRKDGSWMWILSRAKVMSRTAEGKAEWMGGIHTDISEFKQVEISLRDMESFLDRAGRIAGVGAWQVDLRTGKISVSEQTCTIHGVESGFCPSARQALGFYPVAERRRLLKAVRRAIVEGLAWDLELEFIDAQGQQFWVRQFGEVEYDDTGAVRLVGALQDVTKDRRARLQVQRSEELMRGAIDAIDEAFVVFDPQDRLVFCNDKYRALFDKSADLMIVGARFEDILRAAAERGQYPEATGQMETWLAQRLQSHRQGDVSQEQETADGRWLKVIERTMPDGHRVGFRVDITELKLATAAAESVSAALAEGRRRLKSILEGTNVGTWEWNVQTGSIVYNDQYAGFLGIERADLERGGMTYWNSLTHAQDAARAARRMRAHLNGRSALFEAELRVRHRDGHWVWLLARAKLAQSDADGNPVWVYGTHMDITERKLAEKELAKTSTLLQSVLDSATQVGVICTGIDRVIQVFNKGAENLLGYQAEELIGIKTCSQFFDLEELDQVNASFERAHGRKATTQEVFDIVVGMRGPQEWTFVRKDGATFVASVIFSPMLSEQGELNGHLIIVYDISRQKEYESSLRAAMQLAEQSSVAKSEFLANMSHEIRTPMNAILGMLQLLHKTSLDTRQRDYAGKAEGAARSLLGLLNDILDFSKVEAGKMQLDPHPFLLEDLLHDLSVILSSNLGNRNVDLVFDIDPAIPSELEADSLRLKQILINLGGNAVKFTQQGEVCLRWTLLERSSQAVTLELAVQDTGIGIAPENQARIFEAFTQAESNTTRRFGGTGLGLVISTRLIGLMGSELKLVSAVGQGSTFSFVLRLPLVQDASGALAGLAFQADQAPRLAMVIDDNARARDSTVRMVRSVGWVALEAHSGPDALAQLQLLMSHPQARLPDLLLVDWQMPEMDGLETLSQVRQLFGKRTAPTGILLSRHSREALNQLSAREQSLADGFLVRPFTAGMLRQAVAQPGVRFDAAPLLSDTNSGAAPLPALAPLAGMRLLLVEDNPINQQVARELLAAVGAHVTLADNGQAGLDALFASDLLFDAVLMDLQMPVMDGLTATVKIRENLRYRHLPVIAMTANAMESDRAACLAAGMNDHIGKPFELEDLISVLLKNTGRQMPSDAVEPATLGPSSPSAGIDVDTALRRMGGNADLLGRALQSFLPQVLSLKERLEPLMADPSKAELKRELHTFKGLAATLGLQSLSSLAQRAQTEADSATGTSDSSGRWSPLLQELLAGALAMAPVIESTALQLKGLPSPAAGAVNSEWPHQMQQLTELHRALQSGDMQAMELHSALRQSAGYQWSGVFEPLDRAMADLDFEIAAQECEKLLLRLKETGL